MKNIRIGLEQGLTFNPDLLKSPIRTSQMETVAREIILAYKIVADQNENETEILLSRTDTHSRVLYN